MKKLRVLKEIASDESGIASIEFPIIFFFMFTLVMFAFQVSFAMFEMMSAEKAAQTAARIASVRAPVHFGVPTENDEVSDATLGLPCNGSGANCVTPTGGPWVCDGGDWDNLSCDADRFEVIFNDMLRQGINVSASDLTVSYSYAALGFAGGPFVPLIRVTVASKPFLLSFGMGEVLTRREVEGVAIGEDMTTNYSWNAGT